MKSSALPYWLALAVILVAAYAGYTVYRVEQSRPTGGISGVNLPPLKEFELTDQSGNKFRSADMKGKVWVASFFYSTCPYSCAQLNANIKYLTTVDELADVTWVSISVDPNTDTTAVLRDYAKKLNADLSRWHFCRGDDFDYVKRLSEDIFTIIGVAYKSHNDYVVIIDKDGEVAGLFNGYNPVDLEKGVALLKKCLAVKSDDAGKSDKGDKPSPPAEAT